MLSDCSLFYWNYLTLDSHTNTVISHALAFLSRWLPKPWQGLWKRFEAKHEREELFAYVQMMHCVFQYIFFLRKLCYQDSTRNKLLFIKAQVPENELRCSFRVAEKNCCTLKKLLLHSFVWQILCLNSGSCIMRLVLKKLPIYIEPDFARKMLNKIHGQLDMHIFQFVIF